MIIFGWRTRSKFGIIDVRCARCHDVTQYHRMVYRRWFTLFFIPIFPFRTLGDVSTCTQCGHNALTSGLAPA